MKCIEFETILAMVLCPYMYYGISILVLIMLIAYMEKKSMYFA